MEKKFKLRSLYKFIYRFKNKISQNNKIKIGILIFLVICLFSVIIIGNSYANKLNRENINLKVTTNKEKNQEDKKLKEEEEKLAKEKEEKIKKEKENKLKEIKGKIIELDFSYNIEETFGDIDKDIAHYESVYKELEESLQVEESNTIIEENQPIYNDNDNENNAQLPTPPATDPVSPPTEPVIPPTPPVVPPIEPVVPPTPPTPTEPEGDTTPEVPVNPPTENDSE